VENPRAIFRIREMARALGPHFLGGSLGWHDYLASAARLFQHDPTYRIPVKADPNIVVRHIKASHVRLAQEMKSIGGLAIGGMYGVLPLSGDPRSAMVSMAGFIRDVFTQMRRGLDGFWVAHPDFVRTGLALVEACRRFSADPADAALPRLVTALVPELSERQRLLDFIQAEDVPGLSEDDPDFGRSLLAANIQTSEVIANDDPEEVRYNVFQALQYLAAWLSGVGCVALPAALGTASGESVFVRVMDDLATTERSRWELWAEVHHGRVSVELFEQILAEEVAFIRAGEVTGMRRVQVRWEGEAARWYPIAIRLLRQLVRQNPPVEWVTQLLLPFTYEPVRDAADPWTAAKTLCPGRFVRSPDAVSSSGQPKP
jgi:malate synthase